MLSQHPMLIGRILQRVEARQERARRWSAFWNDPMTTLWLAILLVGLLILLLCEVLP